MSPPRAAPSAAPSSASKTPGGKRSGAARPFFFFTQGKLHTHPPCAIIEGAIRNGGAHMNIALLAFDLDGTTITQHQYLPQENRLALEDAAAQGILLVPASGRMKD
ncbi:MAG: HAD family hydrolase, partial [Acutalibacter sp.]